MKLHELELKGKDRYDYKDVGASLSWRSIEQLGPPDLTMKTNIPGIVLRMYEFKGAYKIVVSDRGKPVGFIDFVRPKDLLGNKKLTANTFTPHSGIKKSHTGQGIVSTIYRWFLDAGHNLITGHEQTEASNAMWKSLSRHYDWMLVDKYGDEIESPTEDDGTDVTTRLVLFGKGQTKITESKYSYKGRLDYISGEAVRTFHQKSSIFASSRDPNTIICSISSDEKNQYAAEWDEELFLRMYPIFIRRSFEKQFPGEKITLTEPTVEKNSDGGRSLYLKVKLEPA